MDNAASVGNTQISKNSKCATCSLKFKSITNPRSQPCQHVFSEILLNTEDKDSEESCLECGYVFEGLDFEVSESGDDSNVTLSLSLSRDLENSIKCEELQYKCSQCKKGCGTMIDPRWLSRPVFCMSCLKTGSNKTSALRCLHCGMFFEATKLDKLKTACADSLSTTSGLSITNILNYSIKEELNPLTEACKSNAHACQSISLAVPSPLELETLPKSESLGDNPSAETIIYPEPFSQSTVAVDSVEFLTFTDKWMCDLAGCENGKEAIGFCIHCEDRLCSTHQQTHAIHFKDRHKIVSREIYEECPGKYRRLRCKHHKDMVLIKACMKCDKLVCNSCDFYGEDCSGREPPHRHTFKTFEELHDSIQSHYTGLIEKASERIEKTKQLKTQAEAILNKEKESSQTALHEIDAIRERQILIINEECERAKKDLKLRQELAANGFETYFSRQAAYMEGLSDLKTQAQKIIADYPVALKIQHKDEITKQFSHILETPVQDLKSIIQHAVTIKVAPLKLDINLVRVPTSLSYVSSHEINGSMCLSVSHRKDGSFLVGTDKGLRILSRDKTNITKCKNMGSVSISATIYNEKVCVRRRDESSDRYEDSDLKYVSMPQRQRQRCHKVELLSYSDLKSVRILFEASGISKSMAVSNRYAAMLIQSSIITRARIILYDFNSNNITNVQPKLQFHRISFHPDGDIIAAYDQDKVGKFILHDDGELTEVWTCRGLDCRCGIRFNADGLILVCCFPKQTVYIISPMNGEILQELFHTKLPSDAHGSVSLEGNQLAVPGWNKGEVLLFDIN